MRTGLLASSAALAAGAVGMASGLVPSPSGGSGFGYSLVQDDVQPTARANDTPSVPVTGAPTPPTERAPVPAGRDGARTGSPTPPPPPSSPPAQETRPPAEPTKKPRPSHSAPATKPPAAEVPSGRLPTPRGPGAAVLGLVNEERIQAGCRPVAADAALTELAQDFSEDMAARGFFDHVNPDGDNPWDRALEAGITNLGGENIARGQRDARSVMEAWMDSPGHRANILNCDYRSLGVGVETGGDGPYWTQNFGF